MIPTNWCRSCGGGANFGDQLTPHLLEHHQIPHIWAPPAQARLFMVGSIATKIPVGYRGLIVGTGLIRPINRNLSRAQTISVRGPLTARHLKLPATTPNGDPGLLAGDLLDARPRSATPSTAAAWIPHYVDRRRGPVRHRINITLPPSELLRRMAQTRRVHTSSLHALIAADALGIPHVYHPHPAVIGGRFKFDDYAASLGETIRPGSEHLTPRKTITAKIAEVRSHLDQLKDHLT